MAHGLTTPVTTTSSGTIETALVKNADGSAVSTPTYVDCTATGTAANGQTQWLCAVEAPGGTYPTGAQKFRVKGNSPEESALSVTAGVVVQGTTTTQPTTPTTPTATALARPAAPTLQRLSATSIKLTGVATPNASGYQVQRATSADFTAGLATVYTGTDLVVTDTGVTTPGTYYYRRKALGTGSYSDSPYSIYSSLTLASGPQGQNNTPAIVARTTSPDLPFKLMAEGDSQTADNPGITSYLTQLKTKLPIDFGGFVNFGTNGESIATMLTEVSIQVDDTADSTAYTGPICILYAGINDFLHGARTAQDVYTDLYQWHAGRQAKGIYTIGCTIANVAGTSQNPNGAFNDGGLSLAELNNRIDQLNGLIRATPIGTVTVDIQAVAGLDPRQHPENFQDGLHFDSKASGNGLGLVADALEPAIIQVAGFPASYTNPERFFNSHFFLAAGQAGAGWAYTSGTGAQYWSFTGNGHMVKAGGSGGGYISQTADNMIVGQQYRIRIEGTMSPTPGSNNPYIVILSAGNSVPYNSNAGGNAVGGSLASGVFEFTFTATQASDNFIFGEPGTNFDLTLISLQKA